MGQNSLGGRSGTALSAFFSMVTNEMFQTMCFKWRIKPCSAALRSGVMCYEKCDNSKSPLRCGLHSKEVKTDDGSNSLGVLLPDDTEKVKIFGLMTIKA